MEDFAQVNHPTKRKKIRVTDLFLKATAAILIFAFGIWVGQNISLPFGGNNAPLVKFLNKDKPEEIQVDFAPFWQVWDKVTTDYLERSKLDPQKLVYGAIEGMVRAVGDPYTVFLSPDSNREFELSLSGTYEGAGIEIAIKDQKLVVVAPIEGSPAEKAGVRAGDSLLVIDGKDASALTIQDAVQKIRGEKGTKVKLTLGRDGKNIDVEITRDKIVLKSVIFKDLGEGTALMRITRFGDNTLTEWNSEVAKVIAGGYKRIIIDMRNNPGGRLDQAVSVAGDFVPKGTTILLEEDAYGKQLPFKSDVDPRLKDVKLLVLINKGSASASEIVAGALRDLKGIRLVGETSFGKGTVQKVDDFPDGSGLHITFAKWLTPKGTWVHNSGLKPDIEVKLTEEDQKAGRDPQLQKAKELLK